MKYVSASGLATGQSHNFYLHFLVLYDGILFLLHTKGTRMFFYVPAGPVPVAWNTPN